MSILINYLVMLEIRVPEIIEGTVYVAIIMSRVMTENGKNVYLFFLLIKLMYFRIH